MGILAIPAAFIIVFIGGSIIVGLGEWLFNGDRKPEPKPTGGIPAWVLGVGMFGFWLIFWLIVSAVIDS